MNCHICFTLLFAGILAQCCEAQFRLNIVEVAETAGLGTSDTTETEAVEGDELNGRVVAFEAEGGLVVLNRMGVNNAVRIWNVDALGGGRVAHNSNVRKFRQASLQEIDVLAVEYQLREEQREKLILAVSRDAVRVAELMTPTGPIRDMNQVVRSIEEAREMLKGGAFGENTMSAKVASRMLIGVDTSLGQQERVRNAYQSVMRLIVTELDLVLPLDQQQRTAIDAWIDELHSPDSVALDQIYQTALGELRAAEDLVFALSPPQRAKLDEMQKHIEVGAIKPGGLIKSRRSIFRSLRKAES